MGPSYLSHFTNPSGTEAPTFMYGEEVPPRPSEDKILNVS